MFLPNVAVALILNIFGYPQKLNNKHSSSAMTFGHGSFYVLIKYTFLNNIFKTSQLITAHSNTKTICKVYSNKMFLTSDTVMNDRLLDYCDTKKCR